MLLPVLLLVVFGSAFNGNVAPGITFSQYFLAGMIASGIVYTSFQNLAIAIPQERDDGTLKRLQGTPMPKAAYFVGKVGAGPGHLRRAGRALIGDRRALFDVHLPIDGRGLVDVHLGERCSDWSAARCSASPSPPVPRSGRGAPALVSPVVLVLQFTSGVFFQYDELPPWMQQLAALFPLKWLCQGMRSVFLPDRFQRREPAGSWELERVASCWLVWSLARPCSATAVLPLAAPRRRARRQLLSPAGRSRRADDVDDPRR